jgi:hypothetical protein
LKREPESTVKKIALAPVRLVCGLLQVALIAILALTVALAFVCFSRASQPMNLPATKGMTYNAFTQDRNDALTEKGEVTFLTKTESITWPVFKSFLVSYPATYSALYPESEVSQWLHRKIWYLSSMIPTDEESTWANLPNLFWSAFERTSWNIQVVQNHDLRYPVIPEPTPSPETGIQESVPTITITPQNLLPQYIGAPS